VITPRFALRIHNCMICTFITSSYSVMLRAENCWGQERSGAGRHLQLALADRAAAMLGHLGQVAEVSTSERDRLATATTTSARVCWSSYQTLHQAIRRDSRLFDAYTIFSLIEHPSGVTYPAPGAALRLPGEQGQPAGRASYLGGHTEEVLSEVLQLSSGAIGRLHDAHRVASADPRT
jgi:crotonobetainyl-CoA:carnitine CoA-transferase CaiB-like acyl-CoA transferase